jgi:hypothetical protein
VLQRAIEWAINPAAGTVSTPANGTVASTPGVAPPSITIVGDAASTAKMLTSNTKLIRAMNQAYKQGYPSEPGL